MDGSPQRRRGLRDWAVDVGMFLLAISAGFVMAAMRVDADAMPEPAWLFDVDQIVGVAACAALWLRRRWPVGLAVVLVALSSVFELVAGAMLAALFTVAVHRSPRTTTALFGFSLLTAVCYVMLRPEPDGGRLVVLILGGSAQAAAVGWGLFVQHRRRLVESLRERAVRAEAEAKLRAEQAQHAARDAVAREMHDVLGHRLSLLSVHAGALEFRPDAPAAEISRAAGVIRESAHQALQDLRDVIGVLRAADGELPQPDVGDIRRLVAESAEAGMRVKLREEHGDVPELPGRTACRIVQEALTNVRKHAPGTQVHVDVTGDPERGLTVAVRNSPGAQTPAPAPDPPSGRGLIGLTERVALAGGRFEYGPDSDGGWRLSAWLPWPP
ncbi:MAG: sensor histidine kinase [Stackebrandtia sp.]